METLFKQGMIIIEIILLTWVIYYYTMHNEQEAVSCTRPLTKICPGAGPILEAIRGLPGTNFAWQLPPTPPHSHTLIETSYTLVNIQLFGHIDYNVVSHATLDRTPIYPLYAKRVACAFV